MSEVWCRPQVAEIVTVLSLITLCSAVQRRQDKTREEKRREENILQQEKKVQFYVLTELFQCAVYDR